MRRNYLLSCLLGISLCFVTNTVGRVAIIGGENAGINDFPYQATLLFNGVDDCGGGILDHFHILTSAHCVLEIDHLHFREEHLSVLVGTNDLHVNVHKAADIVEVAKIFIPKDFNFPLESSIGDIAVLKLKHPLKFSKHVSKLELPKPNHNFAGKTAKVAGAGWTWIHVNATGETGGNTDARLRFAEADILHTKVCQISYKNHLHIPINDKRICARVKQPKYKGVCAGDSGAPLVYGGNIVVGILSVSPFGCTERVLPSIYTRVSEFLHFIDDAKHDRNHSSMHIRIIH